MEEIDVPCYFLCPISLQIMKDPVTVSTGISYDRESIEKWLFSGKNNTCPVTKQDLSLDAELTPNHTLRRLIQAWCTINASFGIERIPTPKPPINKTQISKLLKSSKSPLSQFKCLGRLKSLSSENESNKRCLIDSGAVDFLASIIVNNNNNNDNNNDVVSDKETTFDVFDFTRASEEALSVLYNLHVTESSILQNLMLGENGKEFLNSLTKIMQRGSYESRAYAVMLLKSMFEVADSIRLVTIGTEFFKQVVEVLKDQISKEASKATLQLLIQLCRWGRNRVKVVEAGCVPVCVELLLETFTKRSCEMLLVLLEMLCGCAEGRAEFLNHGAGIAVVSKKILRVSQVGNEKAVKILFSISKFSASSSVVQEMLQLGVVTKLCFVLHVDSGNKTKEKAREILKIHARTWKNSSCIPSNLLSSYPS